MGKALEIKNENTIISLHFKVILEKFLVVLRIVLTYVMTQVNSRLKIVKIFSRTTLI